MKKPVARVRKKNPTKKENLNVYLYLSILIPVFILILAFSWYHRVAIKTFFIATFSKSAPNEVVNKNHEIRNVELMKRHADKIFGIDISQYQGEIRWNEVNTIHSDFPIDFIFIRATMGEKNLDKKFKSNWKSTSSRAKLRGAYHYFRPNENSVKQAKNFIRQVHLSPGDLPPVLDIEEHPRNQPMDSLKMGLKRWLDLVEKHYNIKPIVYSGDKYYSDFLEKEFSDYTLWIANYNFWIETPKDHWNFWQFSENGSVDGIRGNVDLNIFDGSIEELESLCIPY